jgi:hypothetical protein
MLVIRKYGRKSTEVAVAHFQPLAPSFPGGLRKIDENHHGVKDDKRRQMRLFLSSLTTLPQIKLPER